jgi:DNA polymerase-3 subunit gamma/tau
VTQALARKWRPRDFSTLVGQEHVVKALCNALRQQRLHHAYLFTGTRGVGKTTLARILAKALNCETGPTPEPCGLCGACVEIDSGRFADLIELDAASNTQVDNMRELLEGALYAPTAGRFKVYIIDEVHMLSRSAFNAMLKTLEEPPQHVKFVLATTEPQKVPVTVLSRCLQFNLKQIPAQKIAEQLARVLAAEEIASEPGALMLISRAAQGSMRDGLSLLDQAIAHGNGSVREDSVRDMLGVVERTYLYALMRALAAQDGPALMAEVERMADRSLSFDAALQDMGVLFHRLALLKAVPDAVSEEEPERRDLETLAESFSAEDLQLYYQIALQGRQDIGLAPDEQAGFSMTMLRMLAFAPTEAKSGAHAGMMEQPPGERVARRAASHEIAAGSKKNNEDSSWREIVDQLAITGMTRMLAEHCVLAGCDGSQVKLLIDRSHGRLLDKPYQERLRAALEQYFGTPVRLVIKIGDSNDGSPAAISDRDRRQRQSQAIAEIEQDPFVRELVENFDATIIESTIKPLQ